MEFFGFVNGFGFGFVFRFRFRLRFWLLSTVWLKIRFVSFNVFSHRSILSGIIFSYSVSLADNLFVLFQLFSFWFTSFWYFLEFRFCIVLGSCRVNQYFGDCGFDFDPSTLLYKSKFLCYPWTLDKTFSLIRKRCF